MVTVSLYFGDEVEGVEGVEEEVEGVEEEVEGVEDEVEGVEEVEERGIGER